jgi:hypothetical protein
VDCKKGYIVGQSSPCRGSFCMGKSKHFHRFVSLFATPYLNLTLLPAAANYLIDTYQALNGASAIAANGLLRYTLGGIFPLVTLQMYHNLGISWATSLLGFISVALMPVPWVLFKFGKMIRARSSYDTLKV